MYLRIENLNKSIGVKDLYKNLTLEIKQGEKIGFIGRNGFGKTTLFKIVTGEDIEYNGQIEFKKGLRIIATKQEHNMVNITPLDYILDELPEYRHLQTIINQPMLGSEISIQEHVDSVNRFASLGYYEIEERIVQTLEGYGIKLESMLGDFSLLSGGEKRLVELTRVIYSNADLILIDEPTNHMDYVAKEIFNNWLYSSNKTIITITHDRDVLDVLSRIIEIKDGQIFSYPGNYTAYINQNSIQNISAINSYEEVSVQIEKLHKQMIAARVRKLEAKTADGRNIAKTMEERFQKQYDALKKQVNKPSIWIDKQSVTELAPKLNAKYQTYKSRNINIQTSKIDENKRLLIKARNLSLKYTNGPVLFQNLNIDLFLGGRIFIKGRNGAGKSTLVKTIISTIGNTPNEARIVEGEISLGSNIRLGIYEQEISAQYLELKLKDAVYEYYFQNHIDIDIQRINNLLAQYLFNPMDDANIKLEDLSGGQKARFQIIKMLVNNPNLLILDEPTNHLDLPSIEELEKVLQEFNGAIIYISHDQYFVNHMGGSIINL